MKNQSLNNAFPIVAAALGNKFGVKVKVGGSDAYTDGNMINLPAYNLEDPSYKDVAWGYLAHEAAHVRFTEFTDFRKAATSPIRRSIVNILEDIRIEKLMQNTYPGTKRTTEKVVEYLVQTGGFQIIGQNEQIHPADVLSQFLLFRLRNDVLGQTALASYADTAESLLEETFPVGAVTRLVALLSEVPEFQVTRDCVRLADRILRMIEEEQEIEREKARQQQQSKSNQSHQEESDDSSSQSQSGQGNTDESEDSTDTSSDNSQQDSQSQGDDSQSDQDADDSQFVQKPDDSEQDDQDQSQGAGSQNNADTDDQDSQPGQSHADSTGSGADDSQDQDSEHTLQALASVLSASEDDIPQDIFEAVQELLGSQSCNSYDADIYMPIAMDPDRNCSVGNDLMNKVLSDSGKIRASLQGLVQSSRCDRSVNKRSGNRIDGRKLSRLI
jgi:hypothetical protein